MPQDEEEIKSIARQRLAVISALVESGQMLNHEVATAARVLLEFSPIYNEMLISYEGAKSWSSEDLVNILSKEAKSVTMSIRVSPSEKRRVTEAAGGRRRVSGFLRRQIFK